MSQSNHRNSSPGVDWLNPSGEWAQEDYGARPAAASEPYDWTINDSHSRPTQVIPIISPDRRGSSKFGWLKRKVDVAESSSTIPVRKNSTGKIFRKRDTGLIRPVATAPLVESGSVIPLVENEKTKRLPERVETEAHRETRRNSPGWALPLLLLAVIALFVFAYIAQK
jgi:hypothetical protein